jgi:hypothetical protein
MEQDADRVPTFILLLFLLLKMLTNQNKKYKNETDKNNV